ncbi:MAG TPA: bifunctional diaminohydroxyphosphoribosylaminopyrimidine deaminase/5-amino-6-(5-phosphoribosylamino)uracil reductase RibD, partial [Beijerinckiaceae bacterium]|nr:bifunctional diaminohydroxyphosphoribosylaminopyrimidine deaminase/5-amino-6-(5-phosphoribosylamino)uracil reductase RibD [Beijerinckiaceae bacterium]
MSTPAATDARFMAAALAYAAHGLGLTRPNPTVAALIVRDGIVIARGRTGLGGRPHGERLAIERAGSAARGATMYVTLEPCARRSGAGDALSCSEAIMAAGLARVVIAADDPSPFAAGAGSARLIEAGIAVTRGVLAEEARRLNLGHVLRIERHRPLVSLKLARTADGFAGTLAGGPIMITGPVSFRHTHVARAEADALMVGVGTVLGDDPKLNCRLAGLEHRSPLRVVVDPALRTPVASYLVRTAQRQPTRIICTETAPEARAEPLRASGVDLLRIPAGVDGRPDLGLALAALAASGITRLMVEG